MSELASRKTIVRLTYLQPTPSQVLGPYFLADAPFATDSIPAGAKGDIVRLRGQVLSEAGAPISGAIVHFWLADTDGVYDNQDKDGNPIKIAREKYRNRVRIKTNARGQYNFQCLRPGNYPLDATGAEVRPGHIHVCVEAAGYKTLVTQLYFIDDAYNKDDLPGDGFFQPELMIHMDPAMPVPGKIQRGVFNFVVVAAK